MKNDLATAIIASVVGITLAYVISNMVISNFAKSSYVVKSVDSSVSSDLAEPNNEVFNFESLNPTVEVYVGDCTEVNMYGECIDESSEQIEQGIIEENVENEEGSSDSSNNNSSNSGSNSSSNSGNSSQNQRNNRNGASN